MTYERSFLDRILPMRECSIPGEATWPDAYAGDLAPFFGELACIPAALSLYRLHGKNSQSRFDATRLSQQYAFEHGQLIEALARLGQPDRVATIDRHLWYMNVRYSLDPRISRFQMLRLILTSPFLSLANRAADVVKMLIRPRSTFAGAT
jgi:hypothetical protein